MPRHVPIRTPDVPGRARYQDYKPQLRQDFLHACGYCGDGDRFYGGLPGYHVDHFAPKKRFPAREFVYTNLVYSCPYCNRGKSDKWIGDDPDQSHDGQAGFIDPCLPDFDDHLERDAEGRFVAKSAVGGYMITHLRLYLDRHRLIWAIQTLHALRERAQSLRHRLGADDARYVPLLEAIAEISEQIDDYSREVFGAPAQ